MSKVFVAVLVNDLFSRGGCNIAFKGRYLNEVNETFYDDVLDSLVERLGEYFNPSVAIMDLESVKEFNEETIEDFGGAFNDKDLEIIDLPPSKDFTTIENIVDVLEKMVTVSKHP